MGMSQHNNIQGDDGTQPSSSKMCIRTDIVVSRHNSSVLASSGMPPVLPKVVG